MSTNSELAQSKGKISGFDQNESKLHESTNSLLNHNNFVGGPPDQTGGSQVPFGEKRDPYKIKKCHLNHNFKLCLEVNPFEAFISSSTAKNYEIVPSHISIIRYATSNCIYLITCKHCEIALTYIDLPFATPKKILIVNFFEITTKTECANQ